MPVPECEESGEETTSERGGSLDMVTFIASWMIVVGEEVGVEWEMVAVLAGEGGSEKDALPGGMSSMSETISTTQGTLNYRL